MDALRRIRAEMYEALSALYAPPVDECRGAREALSRIPGIVEGLTRHGYRVEWKPVGIGDCVKFNQEYTRLFILGNPSPLCPPYESIMLGYPQLMADPAVDALRLYRRAGFDVRGDSPLPPEHIAVELEFMYVLAMLDSNREAARIEKQFLEEHLGRWAGRLASCIDSKTSSNVLRSIARLTRSFVDEDRRIAYSTML